MGVPYFQCKEAIRKHNIAVFSSNYTLYGDLSARVMETLREFTSDVEAYSIDEAFCDLSGFVHLDLTTYGHTLRNMRQLMRENHFTTLLRAEGLHTMPKQLAALLSAKER